MHNSIVPSIGTPLLWALFLFFVGGIAVLDAAVLRRVPHAVPVREAALWTTIWVAFALLFCVGIFVFAGVTPALEFLSAYLIEKALSVDNLFVFVALFSYFEVPGKLQHRVLSWGILAAVVMRAVFILVGITLVARFHWVYYLFGGVLVVTGLKLVLRPSTEVDPGANIVVRTVRRVLPVAQGYGEGNFFVQHEGKRLASPLLLVLVVVEITDVLFATDSVPAVLGVTTDPFIAFTSNILAVLGLRSLFFVLAGLLRAMRFLQPGVALVLVFIGGKMLIADWHRVSVTASLFVILVVLAVSIGASLLFAADGTPTRKRAPHQ